MPPSQYGIESQPAPELAPFQWIDATGQNTAAIKISDYRGKYLVLYCFQSWCPGCHSSGLPALQKMTAALADHERIKFLAIQTVFEGKEQNTFEKLREIQLKYGLKIPFGQDEGDATTRDISSVMYHYRTGGTPWFIFINPEGTVVFNDFHLNPDAAIKYFKSLP